jgi:hypothetical protein
MVKETGRRLLHFSPEVALRWFIEVSGMKSLNV